MVFSCIISQINLPKVNFRTFFAKRKQPMITFLYICEKNAYKWYCCGLSSVELTLHLRLLTSKMLCLERNFCKVSRSRESFAVRLFNIT